MTSRAARILVILVVILGVVVGFASTSVRAAEPSVEQVLLSRELDPMRRPERVESLGADPAPLAMPEDVGQQLSSLLMSPASYTAIPRALRCAFEPEVTLRFHQGSSAIDVRVCFECSQLVFQRPAGTRSPRTLSFAPVESELFALVRQARPDDARLAQVEEQWRERGRLAREARTRWAEAMPEPLRPLWQEPEVQMLTYVPRSGKEHAQVKFLDADVGPLQRALAEALPDPSARIRALLQWYGSGAGPWTGYPSYEGTATRLLLAHPTRELLAAVQLGPLTPEQTEGAARLFASWEFQRERPKDSKQLPAELRRQLLEHSLQGADEDRRARAQTAFGGR